MTASARPRPSDRSAHHPRPDARLRTAAAIVPEITDDIRTLWDDMIDTMDAMPGVGLAAPQVGVALQVAVVDASP